MRSREFPWNHKTVPHGALDICRGCNIGCRECINNASVGFKPLAQVEDELGQLMRHRRLHTVSISGGEPTLHPELTSIIRMVSSRRLRVVLLTNGVRFDSAMASELAGAGLDLVFLHIQEGQRRIDLPPDASNQQIVALQEDKASIAVAAGIAAGLVVTFDRDQPLQAMSHIQTVIDSRNLRYFFGTLPMDTDSCRNLRGDLLNGIYADVDPIPEANHRDGPTIESIRTHLDKAGLRASFHLSADRDPSLICWFCSLGVLLEKQDGNREFHCFQASLIERIFMQLHRLFSGRYPYLTRTNAFSLRIHVLLNGLLGGDIRGNLGIFLKSLLPGTKIMDKHFMIQALPRVGMDGKIDICRLCPDATISNGSLVPYCLSDRIATRNTHQMKGVA